MLSLLARLRNSKKASGIFFNTLLTIKHTEHYINWLQGNIT